MKAIYYTDASFQYHNSLSGYGAVILLEDGKAYQWSSFSYSDLAVHKAELACVRAVLSISILNNINDVVIFNDNEHCRKAFTGMVQVRNKNFSGIYYPDNRTFHNCAHRLSRLYEETLSEYSNSDISFNKLLFSNI
jgi:ribonuclease HI